MSIYKSAINSSTGSVEIIERDTTGHKEKKGGRNKPNGGKKKKKKKVKHTAIKTVLDLSPASAGVQNVPEMT